jgi:threonine dehydrogenase-like Zn-dependent dehydrogenase
MKAVCFEKKGRVVVQDVPEPHVINPHDCVVKVTASAICGSDLHFYNGWVLGMQKGDVLGHEFMGEVVEIGSEVRDLAVGDRVVVPFCIACGKCMMCQRGLFSLCDNTNPNALVLDKMYGQSGGGLFGYSHLYGGYAGGQAQYVRVPFADVGCLKIPEGLTDEQTLFLSDIFPTGYMAAFNCDIQPGDTVAVWGCGPVGQFAIQSCFLLGAERVIAIDGSPRRLELARSHSSVETLNFHEVNIEKALIDMTDGLGPDACIDAVGMEAHGMSLDNLYDKAMQRLMIENDRPHCLRQAIYVCRKGGTVSIPGVYTGFIDKFPLGAAFAKGLTFKMGQTHMHRFMKPCLEHIQRGEIDPTYIISHRVTLDQVPQMYELFNQDKDACTKVVITPQAS